MKTKADLQDRINELTGALKMAKEALDCKPEGYIFIERGNAFNLNSNEMYKEWLDEVESVMLVVNAALKVKT